MKEVIVYAWQITEISFLQYKSCGLPMIRKQYLSGTFVSLSELESWNIATIIYKSRRPVSPLFKSCVCKLITKSY